MREGRTSSIHFFVIGQKTNLTIWLSFMTLLARHMTMCWIMSHIFKNVKFFMDRFHQVNHKCSGIYWLDAFPALFIKWTSQAESINAWLLYLKKIVGAMTMTNAVKFVIALQYHWNSQKNRIKFFSKRRPIACKMNKYDFYCCYDLYWQWGMATSQPQPVSNINSQKKWNKIK